MPSEKKRAALFWSRPAIEQVLCGLWGEMLDTEARPQDSFFDIGGYSLLVVDLVRAARERGVGLKASHVFDHQTPQAIAGILAPDQDHHRLHDERRGAENLWNEAMNAWSDSAPRCLVPIRAEGEGAPLFVVHWGNGNVRFVSQVIDSWRADRPVYGFEAAGYRGHVCGLTSIGEMAERYLAELREHQPEGPYFLAGLCQGGLVALEMARRLRERGEDIGLLALVNLPDLEPIADRGWGLDELYGFRLGALRAQFGLEGEEDVTRVLQEMLPMAWYDEDISENDFYRLQMIWACGVFAQDHYRPRSYDGPALLLESAAMLDGVEKNWLPFLPAATVHHYDVEGTLSVVQHPEVAEIMCAALTPERPRPNGFLK